MKNRIKKILTIVAISTAISSTVLASGHTETIEVMMNSIKAKVKGKYMSGDNILYKGTTYVPLRAVGEILGKDIVWDEKTKTITIDDKPVNSNEGDFKVPAGIPEGAVLVESILEYKYHKFNYIVELPSGSRITQVSISNTTEEGPYIWLVGHDNANIPFIRGRHKDEGQFTSISYLSKYWAERFTEADEELVYDEIGKFFKAYGYKDRGYDEWLRITY